MSKAIIIDKYGCPEVMSFRDISVSKPDPHQVRIKHTLIGVNYHDIYVRSGLYKSLTLPGIPGIEAVGVVTDIGKNVTRFKTGDRVAYVTGEYGVYCTERLINPDELFKIPDALSDELVASVLLRGLTVDMLIRQVHCVKSDDLILIHAAAGGMGQLLCQWSSRIGANVIGTVRTDQQAARAKDSGCKNIIYYKDENVPQRVNEISKGRGVSAVYDGIGKMTFNDSLASLSLCGHLINYGQVSGSVPPIDLKYIAQKSVTLSRPVIFHYLKDPIRRHKMFSSVFNAIEEGWLSASTPKVFDLRDASEAHKTLEEHGAGVPLLLKV